MIWGAICSSSTYYEVAASLDLPQALSFSTWRATTGPNATLGTSGDLYFQWSLSTGDHPCSPMNGSSWNNETCSYSDSWTADLTLDTYSGPSVSGFPNSGAPIQAPPVPVNDPGSDWVPTAVGFCARA